MAVLKCRALECTVGHLFLFREGRNVKTVVSLVSDTCQKIPGEDLLDIRTVAYEQGKRQWFLSALHRYVHPVL